MENVMEHSPTLGKLFTALAKAQKEIGSARKASKAYNYKYADLAEIYEVSRGPMTDNGLCVTSFPDGDGGLITVLGHSSGEFMMSRMHMSAKDKTPQAAGASITYMRRYAYAAICGIATEDDAAIEKKERKAPPEVLETPSNAARWSKVVAGFAVFGLDEATLLGDKSVADKVEDLTEEHFDFLFKWYTECKNAKTT